MDTEKLGNRETMAMAPMPHVFTFRESTSLEWEASYTSAHALIVDNLSKLCKERPINESLELLEQREIKLSRSNACFLLEQCFKKKDLECGKRVQILIGQTGSYPSEDLGNILIYLFSVSRCLPEANQMFNKVLQSSVHWDRIISAHTNNGQADFALELYHRMQVLGVKDDRHVLLAILRACRLSSPFVQQGRLVHEWIISSGMQCDIVLLNTLIDMYSKCWSLDEACKAFSYMSKPDVVSWNVIIAAYIQHAKSNFALVCFHIMEHEDIEPDRVTYLCILKACSNVKVIAYGRYIHEKVLESKLALDIALGNTLVDMYSKCGILEEARKAFNALPRRNVVSWNAMLAGYAHSGEGVLAIEGFADMKHEGCKPDKVTFVSVLQACANTGAVNHGRFIHEQVMENGFERDKVVGNTLADMYIKCGSLEDACRIFDIMPRRDVVSWNIMIAGYVSYFGGGSAFECLEDMQHEGIQPDQVTFLNILKACRSIETTQYNQKIIDYGANSDIVRSLEEAWALSDTGSYRMVAQGISLTCCRNEAIGQCRHIHQMVIEMGIEMDIPVGNTLIDMYAKCGSLQEACKVFSSLQNLNVVTWNAMIVGYAQNGFGLFALQCYNNMQREGMKPDKVTFLGVLKACGCVNSLEDGRYVHQQILEADLQSDSVIRNTLINMYANCGSLGEALEAFDKLSCKDVVSWNVMIIGHTENGEGMLALQCYDEMLYEDMKPLRATYVGILQACANIRSLEHGRWIHECIIGQEIQLDVTLGSTLVDMYAKCRNMLEAHNVFDKLNCRNVVSWNTLLAGYVEENEGSIAFGLFADMQNQGFKPDRVTFLCMLKACTRVGTIEDGRYIHEKALSYDIQWDMMIVSSLVDMYAKCSSLEEACRIFCKLPVPNVVICNAIIAGYARVGQFVFAVQCFKDMELSGIKPNDATFVALLTACSHAGLVEEGCSYFKCMIEYGIDPNLLHCNCMVDVLGHAGYFKEAEDLLLTTIQPNISGWKSLLDASRVHGNMELARRCFNQIIHADPYAFAKYNFPGIQGWTSPEGKQNDNRFIE